MIESKDTWTVARWRGLANGEWLDNKATKHLPGFA